MSEKPEALRLADRLEGRWALHPEMQEAAAELRRLHAQRDALLETLKEIHQATMRDGIVLAKCVGISAVAGIAIAKAERETNGQA